MRVICPNQPGKIRNLLFNSSLVLEAASFDALVERVRMAAPEMLELNCNYTGLVKLTFEAERTENLAMVS